MDLPSIRHHHPHTLPLFGEWLLLMHCLAQGHVGAALVLGGVDPTGAHLFTVAPHGSTDKVRDQYMHCKTIFHDLYQLPYVTMGSGSLAAMAVFETGWKKDMTVCVFSIKFPSSSATRPYSICPQREEALTLVTAAISAGIFNDLGSGSNVDACVITKDGGCYYFPACIRPQIHLTADTSIRHRNVAQPRDAEPTCTEGACIQVPERDDGYQEVSHLELQR